MKRILISLAGLAFAIFTHKVANNPLSEFLSIVGIGCFVMALIMAVALVLDRR